MAYHNRSYLKIRIFVRDQGEFENQPAGILKYVEDLRRGFNTDIGRKDFVEMASNNCFHVGHAASMNQKISALIYL
mgnify:FL=1